MNLTDYQNLESLAAKNGALLVDAADLLAWREEIERLREWARQAVLVLMAYAEIVTYEEVPQPIDEMIRTGKELTAVEQSTPANRTPEQLEHADRLVWAGIQNARKNEAKVKAIKGSRYK